jgi:Fuc2NAc and GlcNAc transferase
MIDAGLYFLSGLALSVPCCFLVPASLVRLGLLDVPGERSSHDRPTPKGGGVGIALAFGAGAAVAGMSPWLWLPLLALAALSFANDLRGISPGSRLAAQFTAAALALGGAWASGLTAWPWPLLLPAVVYLAVWANCYNFMDGINGMAGICGVVAFGCLAGFQMMGDGPSDLLPATMAVLGAIAGFLPFNLPRARLFMGDAGSVLLGIFFGLVVCLLARSWTQFLVLSSFLFPFYADETVTIVERLQKKESLLVAHRRHLYQFFANERGFAHWKVSVGYGLVQLVVALAVILASRHGAWAVLGVNAFGLVVWAVAHIGLKRSHVSNAKEV